MARVMIGPYEVEEEKLVGNRKRALETVNLKSLLEKWVMGEIETADAQVILLLTILNSQLAPAGSPGRIVSPDGLIIT